MASETRLQGDELMEVGWGPRAQTGAGTPELEVQRACGRHRPSPAARLRFDS